MAEKIYSEPGIIGYEDNTIFLTNCPKCNKGNCSAGVVRGICVWCGYNALDDKDLMDRIFNQTLKDDKEVLNRLKD